MQMPKRPNADLKTEAGTYLSKIENNKKYDKETVDSIRVRVPKGWKPIIQDYIKTSGKYTSMNEMFCDLVKKEVGIEIENNK